MQSQIEAAMKVTRSNRAAAAYLRVSWGLYKKFAQAYRDPNGITLFDLHFNRSGVGIEKLKSKTKSNSPGNPNPFVEAELDDILAGKHPNYPKRKLLRRLITSGCKEEKCSHCGYATRRGKDLKVPLILNHISGDSKDHRLANLEILCFNCYFVLVGNIRKGDFDLDKYAVHQQKAMMYGDVVSDDKRIDALSHLSVLTEEEKEELVKSLHNL